MNEVEIANAALSVLGEQATVISIGPPQGGPYAEAAANFLPLAKATVLEAHDWSFATRRAALAQISQEPNGLLVYARRPDMIRVLGVYTTGGEPEPGSFRAGSHDWTVPFLARSGVSEFWVEGDTIRSWLADASARYITSEAEVSDMPPMVARALTWRLAADLVSVVRRSMDQMAEVEQVYMAYLERAKFADVREIQTTNNQAAPWHEHRRWR